MRTLLVIMIGLLLVVPSAFAGKDRSNSHTYHYQSVFVHDDDSYERHTELDLDDGSVFVIGRDEDDRVYAEMEITEDYELYIDGKLIETNESQTKLLGEYHGLVTGLADQAKSIGWEGARIGLAGAKLGVSAIGRVIKMLLTDYDSDDLEYEMERDAEKLEKRAEKIEEKAEELERLVEDLEELHWELEDEIEEVRKLRLF